MTMPPDLTGTGGKSSGWPPAEAGSRAAALTLIGGFEQRCGQGRPLVSEVTFAENRIDLHLGSGRGLSFTDLTQLEHYLATCTPAAGAKAHPTPDPQDHRMWEQWCELLLDLASYPTYFQDLHPGLDVLTVRRRHDQTLITVGDGTTRETYSVALDGDVQVPRGDPGRHPLQL